MLFIYVLKIDFVMTAALYFYDLCKVLGWSGTHAGFWAHSPNLIQKYLTQKGTLTWKVITQSDLNFAHVMTVQLLWHVQNCILIEMFKLELEQKEFS